MTLSSSPSTTLPSPSTMQQIYMKLISNKKLGRLASVIRVLRSCALQQCRIYVYLGLTFQYTKQSTLTALIFRRDLNMSRACSPHIISKASVLFSKYCWQASLKMKVDYFSRSIKEKFLSYCLICSVAFAAELGCDTALYTFVPRFTAAESDVLTYSFKFSLNQEYSLQVLVYDTFFFSPSGIKLETLNLLFFSSTFSTLSTTAVRVYSGILSCICFSSSSVYLLTCFTFSYFFLTSSSSFGNVCLQPSFRNFKN